MIIDSDDDEPPAKAKTTTQFEDKPQFEDEIEDGPYPEIVQTLDLALGTSVLKVAVMPMTLTPAEDAAWGGAKVLTEKMVFAVSCVTNDVYVITLPLTPPSPESKARPELRNDLLAGKAGSGAWGESLILLGGQSKHSEGIAINLIMPKANERPGTKSRAVVASHSREASGVLSLWDVPLDPKDKPSKPVEPFQTEYLPGPLTSISFNSTHTTQLLTVSALQGVRIYDFALPSLSPDPEAAGPFPVQGSWLLSLYQPFARPSSTRKPILDAAWIAHGRAVLALLADGMWGIWDIDGVSPAVPGAAISSKLKSGVRGAALTTFSVSGYVEGTSSLRSVTIQNKESSTGEFAPMTPHTRRQATASLSSAITLDRLATIRGGIKVAALPTSGNAIQDETVVLWVGGLEHVCVIPGISRFWDSQLRKGSATGVDLFSGAQPTRMVKLLDLSTGLLGERCCGVGLVMDPNHGTVHDGGLPADVLVLGESRIVIVREGEDGPGKKIGAVVNTRRRRLFSKGEKSDAIIVHGKPGKPAKISFNLSTVKPGTLRLRSASGQHDITGDVSQSDNLLPPSRPRVGFDFMDTLNAAADVSDDFTSRDVEVEMLDIMEIDKTLDSMSSGRRRT
ncbi:Nucleoporin NUP37 [Fusarium albosuccineum]|uniref:Nucleoporin NUP37 n=1 Tax=Fusarium albosuccineum TaxID=1237068 RepID=A0A8H4L351_9HYPO|nr:Nucleoporin NUP37 [Fusarium albosuccineum]